MGPSFSRLDQTCGAVQWPMFIRGRSLRSSGPIFYKCSTTATAIGRARRSCSVSQFADCASNFPTSQTKGFLFRRHTVQAAATPGRKADQWTSFRQLRPCPRSGTGRRGKTAGPETRSCEAARSKSEGGPVEALWRGSELGRHVGGSGFGADEAMLAPDATAVNARRPGCWLDPYARRARTVERVVDGGGHYDRAHVKAEPSRFDACDGAALGP
jgi:hypothetical protein